MTSNPGSGRQPGLLPLALSSFILASSFPYIFVGPAAGWISLGLGCFGLVALRGILPVALRTQPGAMALIFSWLALIMVTLVLDTFAYVERDILAGPFLSLLTLLIFIAMFVTALVNRGQVFIVTIALVVLVQSATALLQYIGLDWAWHISTTLNQVLPLQPVDRTQLYDAADVEFSDIGRVRGTHMLVHNFNGVQAALVGICTYMSLNPHERELPRGWLRLTVQVAAVVGAVGMLLSFSRSGILALAGVVAISLLVHPRPLKLAILAGGGLAALLLLYGLEFTDSAQFSRLTQAVENDHNVQIRFEQYGYAFDNFLRSPLIGVSGLTGVMELDLPIHSVPMRFLNDYGMIGVLLYALTVAWMLIMPVNHMRSGEPQRIFWGGAALCLAFAMLADGATHSSGFLRRDLVNGMLFGLLIGQASRVANRAQWERGLQAGGILARRLSRAEPA